MSVGQLPADFQNIWNEPDWVEAFFRAPITARPGLSFEYNNFAAFILSAIIHNQLTDPVRRGRIFNVHTELSAIGLERDGEELVVLYKDHGKIHRLRCGTAGQYSINDYIYVRSYWPELQIPDQAIIVEGVAT